MEKIAIFIAVLMLTFLGCKEHDNIVSSNSVSGKIILKIDKENAPKDVKSVVATLKRDGFDSITGNLRLSSENSATIILENIDPGVWHLLVEAKDSLNNVLYVGETDVEVVENFTTQVNLVLTPTGNGKGSIQINVTWGGSNSWIDYMNNPLIRPNHDQFDFAGVMQPKLLIENGKYRMWYLGLGNSSRSHVLYAESNDGINWIKPFSRPVLYPGEQNSWDETAAIAGAVLKEDNGYKMYYVGWSNQYSNWHIGLATSSDGINWRKYPHPVIFGTNGWEYQIVPSSIFRKDGKYYLYYYGRNYPEYSMGLAYSDDGINWTKYSSNPILQASENWEGTGIFHPSIIFENGKYTMVYMNANATAFGLAESYDGKNWTKNNSNPFFSKNQTANNWGEISIAYPFLLKIEERYKIYYSGSNSGTFYNIGLLNK